MGKPQCLLIAVLLLVVAGVDTEGVRILGLFPAPTRSHTISFTALTQELARRGHHVTVVSGFPVEPPLANYTDITAYSSYPDDAFPNMFTLHEKFSAISMLTFMWDLGLQLCERELKHPEVQKLIQDTQLQFDLIIMEKFFSECFYGFVYKYKVPTIDISSNSIALWMGDGVGNPFTASYIPEVALGFKPQMTFIQRLLNTVVSCYFYVSREFYYLPKQHAVIKQHFKDPSIPSIQELERNVSLLLLNSHVSLSYPRPFTPNTIEVGGMHIKPGNELPKDLQTFMDDASDGVVYFSLGSLVRNKDMPETMRQSFLDAFSKLKQKVLWKWEADAISGMPENVRLEKWIPQNDILAHPNLRLFMTHSGMLSTQEAIYHGVPLVAVPVGGDQVVNAVKIQDQGCGIMLQLSNITSQSLSWAMGEILGNPRYREKVKQMSALFRDQPQSPLEKAVYWTEYVIRHRGAPHLRSAALDLWWFQYYLLDVLAVLLGGVAVCVFLMSLLCHTLYRLVFSKASKTHKRLIEAKKIN